MSVFSQVMLGIVDFAEVAVVGRLRINRAEQIELLDDVGRLEAEDLQHRAFDFLLVDRCRAEGVDVNADRLRMADGVGKLNFALGREAGCDDVLRHLAAHVSRAAIHLGRILAGESAAAVTAHAAVAIDDDLAAGQAGVALRTADHETAGRVDQKFVSFDRAVPRAKLS